MNMMIRKANAEDAKPIATYLMLAMEDIFYGFIGERNYEVAIEVLEELIQSRGNQYSFENCWVAELDSEPVAVACVYNGGNLYQLRKPVGELIKTRFNRDFNPEDETQSGEFYIDCVGVSEYHQGKGLGSKMFNFLIDEFVHKRNETLGLLVEEENPNAKRLYQKLGFKVVGEKTLMGKKLDHMQIS
ncbi:GNAT family N-acetyltransferase [Profundicola chukchiensis]|uniref:GNAT family N-acetyltransferase n=1 Tax=Profundicola chukchiensis TaxID=2961959 RepID=UPI0026F382C1|nr:N-acetyltransferase [Profundicola chukchiensis]